ncbi:MAG: hypothetical protein ACOYOP_01455 [Microthrixaceae bacterium]
MAWEGDRKGRMSATPRRSVGSARRAALVVLVALVGAALLSCGASRTAEVSGSGMPDPVWGVVGTADDSPDGLVADPSATSDPDGPEPQVMAEVTLPDGAVPTLPQPGVPAAVATPDAGGTRAPAAAPPTTADAPGTSDRAVERLGSEELRDRAARALGRIRYDWRSRLPGWQVRFLPGRDGLRGSTFPRDRVIEVYVRRNQSVTDVAHVIAHELGHAVDVSLLTDADRAAWLAARGVDPGTTWFPGESGVTDFSTGAGDFAESFAHWQVGDQWYSRLGPPPDAATTGFLASLART